MTQIRPIAIVFTLPEVSLAEVRAAMRSGDVPVIAYDQDGVKAIATGKLQVVDNQVDQATGTIRLKAIYENTDDALWPGQYTPVRVQVSLIRNAVTLPTTAIQRGPNGIFVWSLSSDDRAAMKPVETGPTLDDVTVALKGVSEGDRIIASNFNRMQPNVKVRTEARPVAVNAANGRS